MPADTFNVMKKSSNNTNKIKVCFVCPKAYPLFDSTVDAVFGGAEVDLYLLSTELAKDTNYEVSCIVADYDQPQTQVIENVKVIKGLDFRKTQLSSAISLWRTYKTIDADIYMLETASPGVPLTQMFCRKHNKHFVYRTAHLDETDGKYRKQNPVLGCMFERALKKCSQVIVQNQVDYDNLSQRLGLASIIIPNGHRLTSDVDDSSQKILWVGRSAKFKRPYLFIELARKNPDKEFTMICQHATEDNDYHALVAQAESVSNLQFIQRVPFAQIDEYFSRASVLVNTSTAEGFANVFIQAFKHAVPVITLNVNPDNFLDEYKCGICCDDDFELLQNSLDILTGPQRQTYSENAFKYVQQKHDIVKITQQYKVIFKELLSHNGD